MVENENHNDQELRDELQCRSLLLSFYSSQHSTHGRLIIGFAVILFTILEITVKLQELPVQQDPSVIFSCTQSWIAFSGLLLSSSVFWFLLMRDVVYGILSNAVIHSIPSDTDPSLLMRVATGARDYAIKHSKIYGLIPVTWFFSVGEKPQRRLRIRTDRLYGFLLCLLLAIITTTILGVLIRLVHPSIFFPFC